MRQPHWLPPLLAGTLLLALVCGPLLPCLPPHTPTSRMRSVRRYESRAAAGPMQYASSAMATCCSVVVRQEKAAAGEARVSCTLPSF